MHEPRCSNGNCCSKEGWCGASVEWCGVGCQSAYGQCLGTQASPSPKPSAYKPKKVKKSAN